MIQRWFERRRRARDRRAADELQAWLAGVRMIAELCSASLKPKDPRTDIGVALDRIDRELLRFRGHIAAAGGALRRRSLPLRPRFDEATRLVYCLRNDTCSYLLRWQSFQQQQEAAGSAAVNAQRQMEEALLKASRTSRQLTQETEMISSELESLLRDWQFVDG